MLIFGLVFLSTVIVFLKHVSYSTEIPTALGPELVHTHIYFLANSKQSSFFMFSNSQL